MITEIDKEIERLVTIQKVVDARLSEINWYLNIENTNLSNIEQYRKRLENIHKSLVCGLFSDLSQVDAKVKAVYSLYQDLLKEISNLSAISTSKSISDFT